MDLGIMTFVYKNFLLEYRISGTLTKICDSLDNNGSGDQDYMPKKNEESVFLNEVWHTLVMYIP